jgi:hypothetical protein
LKQAWYKSFERVRLPDKPVSEINVLYSGSLDTIGERATAVNPSWLARYQEWVDEGWIEAVSLTVDRWRLPMFDSWVAELGALHFASVGVWEMLESVNLLEVSYLPSLPTHLPSLLTLLALLAHSTTVTCRPYNFLTGGLESHNRFRSASGTAARRCGVGAGAAGGWGWGTYDVTDHTPLGTGGDS